VPVPVPAVEGGGKDVGGSVSSGSGGDSGDSDSQWSGEELSEESSGEVGMVDFEEETRKVLGETGLSVREREEQLGVLIELAMDAMEPVGCWEALVGIAETLAAKSPQNPEVAETLAAAMRDTLEPVVELGSEERRDLQQQQQQQKQQQGGRGSEGAGAGADGVAEGEKGALRGVEGELLEEKWVQRLDVVHSEFKAWGVDDFGKVADRMRELIDAEAKAAASQKDE